MGEQKRFGVLMQFCLKVQSKGDLLSISSGLKWSRKGEEAGTDEIPKECDLIGNLSVGGIEFLFARHEHQEEAHAHGCRGDRDGVIAVGLLLKTGALVN